MMIEFDQIDTNCVCQYTLTIRDKTIGNESANVKDNFNNIPSMHEIDEEDDDENYAENCSKDTSLDDSKQIKELTEDADKDRNNDQPDDDESTYSDDSFCSDVSYQDTEEIAATASSAQNRSSPPLKLDNVEDDSVNAKDEERTASADLECVDYENYITGSLENLTQSEKLVGTRCRRRNMSFTDEEMRKIERENELLLRKIMAQHRPRNKANEEVPQRPRASSSAINRKKLQRKIEGDNMLLLRRIQQAKPRVMTKSAATGYRLTLF